MTRYAYYDSTQPAPQRVIGWYDTEFVNYPTLPIDESLLIVSDAQWDDRMTDPSGWAVDSGTLVAYVPPPPPPPTLEQQAATMLAGPVPVKSTGTPSLNGSYKVDIATQTQITAIASGINAGLGLPSGTSTFNWPDSTGTAHQWNETQFLQFAQSLMLFLYTCSQVAGGHSSSLPASTITIA